jgi:hypothetical protein
MKPLRVLLTACLTGFALCAVAAAHEGEGPAPQAEPTPPGTGFEGRVLCEAQVVTGARVYAYRSFKDLLAFAPAFVSAPSADNGTWKMDVPRGKYYLVAKKIQSGTKDGPLGAGDLFSFQGSNPIVAVPGKYTHVGFSLVRMGQAATYEDSADAGSGSIAGTLTNGGEPVEGAAVVLYLDGNDDFRGQGYSTSPPTGKNGTFRIDSLPDSDYFLLARKRTTGRGAGPLTDGDYFGYYIGNPVPVKAGKVARITIEMISKAGEIGKEDSLFRDTGTHITGRILDKDGKVVPGVYAFAYEEKVMAHKRPEYISREVDGQGRYVLNLSQGGVYYVGARSSYGETPALGEWYGRYEGTGDHSVRVETGKVLQGIDLVVERILP